MIKSLIIITNQMIRDKCHRGLLKHQGVLTPEVTMLIKQVIDMPITFFKELF